MGKKAVRLTEKQIKFCRAFMLNGGNATQAAKTAGYKASSYGSLRVQGYNLLTIPNVLSCLQKLRKESEQEFGATAEEVISGLRDVRNGALDKDDFFAAGKSLELLGKTRGMFLDRQEIALNIEALADKLSGESDMMEILE